MSAICAAEEDPGNGTWSGGPPAEGPTKRLASRRNRLHAEFIEISWCRAYVPLRLTHSLRAVFGTYLRRELVNRRRQTLIVAIGMALAIALVLVVNAIAGGVRTAQAVALQSVYGVGTDITVTKAATTADGGPQRFQFGSGSGAASGGTRTFNRNRLAVERGVTTFASTAVAKAQQTAGVKAATGVLSLNDTSFTGQIPTQRTGRQRRRFTPGATRPTGGPDGPGRQRLRRRRLHRAGYDVSGAPIGPLTAATLTSGRALHAADSGKDVAVLDSDYATTAKKKVGDTISIGGTTTKIVGIVKSTSATGASGSNVYLPLSTAQKLASETGKISSIYVEATSASRRRQREERAAVVARLRHDREHGGGPRLQRHRIAQHRIVAGELPRAVALDRGARGGVPARRAVHRLGRHAAHPRVRHAEGHRLERPSHRRPGGG